MIEIHEHYKNFDPPKAVRKSIERLLAGIPQHTLTGLHSIVLTSSQALNRKKRRKKSWSRNKKISVDRCGGWYCGAWKNEPAYIEIVVDNIIRHKPRWIFRSRFFTDVAFSIVLFHEIGHHIHHTQQPEFKEKEDVADNWQKKLSKHYIWNKYRLVMVLLYPFKGIIRRLGKKSK